MSLFLSKLLPVFIYPLGLSVLLGAISLFILWWQPKRSRRISNVAKGIILFKKTRISAVLLSIALVLLLLSSNDICSRLLVQSLERQYVPKGELPTAEAIVILGGATRPKIAPRPWYEVNEAGDRLLYGALLYKQQKAPLIVVTGGRAEWLGEGGNPESEDMAAILELMGVPREAIIQESQSFNTRDNAVNTRQILRQRNISKVLLVTSALHMPRSMEIFRKIGLESIAAPTDFLAGQSDNNKGFAIILDLLPSVDALKNTTNAIKEYVGLLVYQLAGWA
ncbi:YdcF family protein [Pseudanabaena mucicola]|uniref:YdcF family protein n=1 Tax=Pseudanabaena mucicola FACHB-723 TaxID=2692860 RepID=A0ABR7ZWE6_9CYAN|nr:YdcF family protein [Pseudanabaena mucicola]MBD2187835.1 YdcF family protein [Pseudanabaena mucicola FACHB-723]